MQRPETCLCAGRSICDVFKHDCLNQSPHPGSLILASSQICAGSRRCFQWTVDPYGQRVNVSHCGKRNEICARATWTRQGRSVRKSSGMGCLSRAIGAQDHCSARGFVTSNDQHVTRRHSVRTAKSEYRNAILVVSWRAGASRPGMTEGNKWPDDA
jgi:hypothetical protein